MPTPPDHDPALRALLRRADPAADLPTFAPASFAAGVHTRIPATDTADERSSRPSRAFFGQLFPLAAALAVIASLGAGSAAAYASSREAQAETFAAAFARSIDPWQMHAAPSEHIPPRATSHAH